MGQGVRVGGGEPVCPQRRLPGGAGSDSTTITETESISKSQSCQWRFFVHRRLTGPALAKLKSVVKNGGKPLTLPGRALTLNGLLMSNHLGEKELVIHG
jgi:hypothetical protein